MPVERAPVVSIEDKHFDQLSNPIEIAVCAFISRHEVFSPHNKNSEKIIKGIYGLSDEELEKVLNRLIEIGFLIVEKS